MHGGRANTQAFGILLVFGDVALGHFGNGDSLFVGLLDELIIDVGEVLHKSDIVAAVFQIAAQHIEYTDRAGVADVDKVIDCGAAGIDADLTRLQWHKFFLLTGQGIVDSHIDFLLSNSSLCPAGKTKSLRQSVCSTGGDLRPRFHSCLSLVGL